jgi:hypothetical protein
MTGSLVRRYILFTTMGMDVGSVVSGHLPASAPTPGLCQVDGRSGVARLQHLVVLIPGIGGSVLGRAGDDGQIAGTQYAVTSAGLAATLLRPGRLDLDRYPDLVPVDLVDDFTALSPLVSLAGYERFGRTLHRTFGQVVTDVYRPPRPLRDDVDVVRFPYDFRKPMAEAAQRLDDAISEALSRRQIAEDQRPVIIIAHSLGGLVARYWLGVLDGWKRCHALMCMGTPHRGAPKALDWLINGAGTARVRDQRFTEVIRKWPSVYELLPQYEAVWDPTAGGGGGAPFEFTELPWPLLAGRPDLADYSQRFCAMAAAGRLVHEQISTAWAAIDPGQMPRVTAFMGRGHDTPNLAVLDSGRLRVMKEDPPWRGNVGWRGDGTVPMLGAIPREQSDRQHLWRVMSDRHGELGSIPEPVRLLGLYAGDRVPVRGGELPARPWLGLDIDEFVPAGVEIAAAARLLPETATGSAAWITVTPMRGTPGEAYQDRLPPAEAEPSGALAWHGVLPPRGPGIYSVRVEVTDVPRYGAVPATVTVVVLDQATGDLEGDW